MSTQIAKSVEIKVPNFQKDVIYPAIYDLENMKLIQSCAYPLSPKNKVIELKKKNIQKVIRGILNKPHVSTNVNIHSKCFNTSQKFNTKVETQLHYGLVSQKLEKTPFAIQIDEQLGQLAVNMEDDFAPFSERVKKLLKKANHCQRIDEKEQHKIQEVQKFVNVICQSSKLRPPNPDRFKKVTGLIEDLDQLSKQKPPSVMRKRAQSAKVLKSDSQSQSHPIHSRRLSQSRMMVPRHFSINIKGDLKPQLNKSKRLFDKINAYYEGQNRDKKRYQSSLAEMRSEWGEQGPLQRLVRSKIQELNPSTLDLLRERRLKQSALALIDSQYLQL